MSKTFPDHHRLISLTVRCNKVIGEVSEPYKRRFLMSQKDKKPGFSNPALRAMGIPTIRLPSRNWCIFWSVLAFGIGGVAYDKYAQRKIRAHYISMIQDRTQEAQDVYLKSRKLTVFIAPPPSDFLENSMKVWRRHIKPVLFHAGLDYDVFTEERQGLIRYEVAERIRKLRKDLLETNAKLVQAEEDARWINRVRAWWSPKERLTEEEIEALKEKKWRDEFSYNQVLGVYYKNTNSDSKSSISEDTMVNDASLAGGVICIGRGAYKEYVSGVMEGVLGPLDPPPKVEDELPKTESEPESDPENDSKKGPPPPYITPEQYPKAPFPQELTDNIVRDPETKIPAIFQQPLLVVRLPGISGFTQIPKRIYRFYTARYYAEECYKAAMAMVLQHSRPFNPETDLQLAYDEEIYWPKAWVKRGEEKGSLWVQNVVGDNRVLSRMHIVEPK
ncbi:HBR369Wp [Eremothecium sinecaudum]|uniref:Mitochondrial import inner membrane translocase subunit TIM54 n=1 Tax=Eremothecium sinecaudum TaxID=45286 RepID=A0A125RE32_9SACH|nr:HBR369Wp [Eremothecium sinecaudum]AMD19270.1 HBR369Wp [Eremothecium sinecaudum]